MHTWFDAQLDQKILDGISAKRAKQRLLDILMFSFKKERTLLAKHLFDQNEYP